MLRDKNLIPLSHQHQRALALCVRIDRASPIATDDLHAWQAEAAQLFRSEITFHFAAEEQVVFPAAAKFAELTPLIEDLHSDHDWLREQFSRIATLNASALNGLAARLSAHIRKEERQLFERVQLLMTREELAHLGEMLTEAMKDATQECALPSEATKLKPAKAKSV